MKILSNLRQPTLLDIHALTASLPGDSPGGADLRYDVAYQAIVDARREENARLPQGIWVRDIKRADWPAVERMCTSVLRTRGKDLQVACWLVEAVVHRTGFAGLAPGLQLLSGLCRNLWPVLHPAIEDGDLTARLAPFEWMNARFLALLRNQPIVCSSQNPEEFYTWTDYANAQLLEGLRQRDPKSVERSEAAGAATLAMFNTVRGRTDTRFWQDNKTALDAATTELTDLNATLEALCGREAPGLGAIHDTVSDIMNLTAAGLAERQPKTFSLLRRPQAASSRADATPAAPAMRPPSDTVQTAEDTYAQLAEIADMLERQEPHSPTPYLVRCAVACGHMTFAELLMNFAGAGLDLGKVFETLGLAGMSGSSDGGSEVADES